MEITITIPQLIGSGILAILLNVAVWIFTWGRTVGRVCEMIENQDKRIEALDDKIDAHIGDTRCHDSQTQTEINRRLSNIEGKLELVLGVDK